jgi:SpoIID/LytB domain protein
MLLLLAALSLQPATTQVMRGVDGVVLVADLTTGKLLASHRLDRATTRRAAPGSALKPFTLVALIDAGAAGERIACTGRLRIGERQLDCGHPSLASPLDAEAAIAYSCNTWFARVASRLDPIRFAHFLREWEFDAAQGVTGDERSLQAIGEYGVHITPRRLLDAYRRLARLRNESKYQPVFRGMQGAVEYGSAQLAAVPGLPLAGKTGTTPNPSRTATHAWFVGLAPAGKPEVVSVVFLEQGRGGPTAAPIAGRILSAWQASLSQAAPRPTTKVAPPPPGSRLLRIGVRDGTVRTLTWEEYVEAVLAGESAAFPEEAMKAMAIAARSYATANRGRHKAQGWDFCDTSHCQNLRFDRSNTGMRAALESTEGILLWYAGKAAQTYYHRHCGGVTEAGHDMWPQPALPYLLKQVDTFCLTAGKVPWRVEAENRRIEIASRSPSGRVASLIVDGRRMSVEIVRAKLRLLSGWFDVRQQGNRSVFEGFGAGHGVGMCQTGAAERARKGHSWKQILAFYYPGTRAGLTAQGIDWSRLGGERLDLWTTMPSQDPPALAVAERMLREAESRTGFRYIGRARLRIYPTIDTYRDATGEPGWIAGSTTGGTVRLQPPSLLRAKGVLESTLLHEMLHLVIEQQALAGSPRWFREGLVLWLSEPNKPASSATAPIENARTESQLRDAYDAARARVKRLADRHGRDVVLSWIQRGLPHGLSELTP